MKEDGLPSTALQFPVGYHQHHHAQFIDYQLSRWHFYGYWSLDDLLEAARHIKTREDWRPEMPAQAEMAEAEGSRFPTPAPVGLSASR